MRAAAASAKLFNLPAARSIAQMVCNVDIGSNTLTSAPKVADSGKVSVNRVPEGSF
jgi:hypothetical protein